MGRPLISEAAVVAHDEGAARQSYHSDIHGGGFDCKCDARYADEAAQPIVLRDERHAANIILSFLAEQVAGWRIHVALSDKSHSDRRDPYITKAHSAAVLALL